MSAPHIAAAGKPQPSAAEIERLCAERYASMHAPDGGVRLDQADPKFQLTTNGVVFPQLDLDGLGAAIVGLTPTMLAPGCRSGDSIALKDQIELWSWCAQLLLGPRSTPFRRDAVTADLYKAAVNASLANCYPVDPRTLPARMADFLHSAPLVAAHLVFPLLDSVFRRACSSHLSAAGDVLQPFEVNGTAYAPVDSKGERRCSSVRDLLDLHYLHVAPAGSPKLQALLTKLYAHVASAASPRTARELIADWRNPSLHGQDGFHTIAGTVLNLCFLVSLFEIEPDFEARRAHAQWISRWWHGQFPGRGGARGPGCFYPP